MQYTSDYMRILEETLEKKAQVLQALLEASRRQEALAEEDAFDMDRFSAVMAEKDALLEQLQELDAGFQETYDGVRGELTGRREQYADAIRRMQAQIRKVTDLGVELQAQEARNRTKLEVRFAGQQKELRRIKTSSRVASQYYRSMAKLQGIDSYFLDQKK